MSPTFRRLLPAAAAGAPFSTRSPRSARTPRSCRSGRATGSGDCASSSVIFRSATRLELSSTDSTCTQMISPSLTTSRGCWMCRSASALTCTRPSTPGKSSTKAPNGCSRATLPCSFLPSASCGRAASHGSCSSARSDKAMRSWPFSSFSMRSTCTLTFCPGFTTSCACATRACDSSLTCTRPSRPPRSTKAPKSRTEVMVPSTCAPTSRCLRSSTALTARSSSISARRDKIAFPPRSSVTRNWSRWPTNCAGSSMNRTSICEVGTKARVPPMSTSSPPLLTPVTRPSTGILLSSAFCNTSRPAPFGTERVMTTLPSASEST